MPRFFLLSKSILETQLALTAALLAAACSGEALPVGSDGANAGASGTSASGSSSGGASAAGSSAGAMAGQGVYDATTPPGTTSGSSGSGPGTNSNCPIVPAPTSPPSSATGVNLVGEYGSTINIVDGFAEISSRTETGILYTLYQTTISFMFTDFPNAAGYARVDALPSGSRILFATDVEGTGWGDGGGSVVGTYPAYSWTLEAVPSDCGNGLEEDTVSFGSGAQLTVSSLSETRIQGSITVPAFLDGSASLDASAPLDPAAASLTFDIPVLRCTDAGGPLVGPQTSLQCCVP